MRRNADIASLLPDPTRHAAGLPIGAAAAYFVGGQGEFGQAVDASVLNPNAPPDSQPGLWCQWIPSDDGGWLRWDEGEKFYFFVGWVRYLIEHFLEPWGYIVAGYVTWTNDEDDQTGAIRLEDNRIVELINDPDDMVD
jgi:hypothetical protein